MATAPLSSTLGAIFLGNVVAATLYGITTVQTFIYFSQPRDGLGLKSAIFALWTLDTLHTMLLTYSSYYYCILNFAIFEASKHGVWSVWVQGHVTCIIEFTVRGLFTTRVWRLTNGNVWIVTVITMFSMVHLGAGTYLASILVRLKDFDVLQHHLVPWYLSGACGAAADALIASALVKSLWRARTGFKRTDRLISTLVIYAVSTGSLTSVWIIVCIITAGASPDTLIFLGLFFLIPKLSINALLANLNMRGILRGVMDAPLELVDHPSRKAISVVQIDVQTNIRTDSVPEQHNQSETKIFVETNK